ncbi:MAG: DUF1080 domain-containing protein [Planctomycetes bacterium]|nr:DUF1080 domain-containing protein [Planctomycetota bacterium]
MIHEPKPETSGSSHAAVRGNTRHLTCLTVCLVAALIATGCGIRMANTRPLLDNYPNGWAHYLADPNVAMQGVWQIHNDVLICKGTPLGYLYTTEAYDNFSLEFQWRWAPGKTPGKGGVLIRMTGAHKIWPRSLEAQINVNDAGDFWGLDGYSFSGDADRRKTLTHDIYGELTHFKKTQALEKALGEWNTYEILAQGDTVTLLINGEQVNEATDCDSTPGKICLTSEGTEIHFRHISLTRLD